MQTVEAGKVSRRPHQSDPVQLRGAAAGPLRGRDGLETLVQQRRRP
jgi:hypothetical protein